VIFRGILWITFGITAEPRLEKCIVVVKIVDD
jgi:hypothetical protein